MVHEPHTSHALHPSKHIAEQHASHIFINVLMNLRAESTGYVSFNNERQKRNENVRK